MAHRVKQLSQAIVAFTTTLIFLAFLLSFLSAVGTVLG